MKLILLVIHFIYIIRCCYCYSPTNKEKCNLYFNVLKYLDIKTKSYLTCDHACSSYNIFDSVSYCISLCNIIFSEYNYDGPLVNFDIYWPPHTLYESDVFINNKIKYVSEHIDQESYASADGWLFTEFYHKHYSHEILKLFFV